MLLRLLSLIVADPDYVLSRLYMTIESIRTLVGEY